MITRTLVRSLKCRVAEAAEAATVGIASGGYKSRFISHRNFL